MSLSIEDKERLVSLMGDSGRGVFRLGKVLVKGPPPKSLKSVAIPEIEEEPLHVQIGKARSRAEIGERARSEAQARAAVESRVSTIEAKVRTELEAEAKKALETPRPVELEGIGVTRALHARAKGSAEGLAPKKGESETVYPQVSRWFFDGVEGIIKEVASSDLSGLSDTVNSSGVSENLRAFLLTQERHSPYGEDGLETLSKGIKYTVMGSLGSMDSENLDNLDNFILGVALRMDAMYKGDRLTPSEPKGIHDMTLWGHEGLLYAIETSIFSEELPAETLKEAVVGYLNELREGYANASQNELDRKRAFERLVLKMPLQCEGSTVEVLKALSVSIVRLNAVREIQGYGGAGGVLNEVKKGSKKHLEVLDLWQDVKATIRVRGRAVTLRPLLEFPEGSGSWGLQSISIPSREVLLDKQTPYNISVLQRINDDFLRTLDYLEDGKIPLEQPITYWTSRDSAAGEVAKLERLDKKILEYISPLILNPATKYIEGEGEVKIIDLAKIRKLLDRKESETQYGVALRGVRNALGSGKTEFNADYDGILEEVDLETAEKILSSLPTSY